jgi:hypothetical protein
MLWKVVIGMINVMFDLVDLIESLKMAADTTINNDV